jgi:penicillin G amidase
VARRRTRSRLRTLAAFVSGLCLFVALILGGGLIWLRTSLPQTSGTLTVAGLAKPVTIVRDADGIPHVRAETTADAYFALGFVHAQDRLWQMETYRRAGQGRLAEIVGKPGLASDRFARVLGYERLARAALAQLSPEARAAVDAYTAGVNAWIDTHGGALPPEFVALRFAPEPWRPEDCLIWGKLMATRLSNWPVMIARLRYAAALTPADEADLFPPYPPDAPLTIDDALGKRAGLDGGARVTDHRAAALPSFGADPTVPAEASNAFALSGEHTESGKPLLANDPHLGFEAPNLWYLVRIDAPGLTLAGATIPSVPFLIIGHNGHVAWGFTTTGAETDALYAERLEGADGTRIVGPQGPEPLAIRAETIAVSGGEPERLTVRESRHGPILSDIMNIPGLGPGEVAALDAPALRPDDRTAEAFYRANLAQNAEEFRAAMRDFQSPMQNAMFADASGSIGFATVGRMPIREDEAPASGLRPGWVGGDDERFVPFDEMPQIVNPPRGEIVNANNKVVGPEYPHFLGTFWAGADRAQRIEDRLKDAKSLNVPALAAIQTDAVSLGARALLPRLLPLLADAGLDRTASVARDRLRQWDGTMSRAAPEPLIYHAWIAALARSLAAERGQANNAAAVATIARPAALSHILSAPERWCANAPAQNASETGDDGASCQPLVAGAFAAAIDMLTERFGDDPALWRWGDAHRAVFAHPLFASFPLLDRVTTINIATDGDDDTVNRGTIGFGARRTGSIFYRPPLYPDVHGPGLRAIMDLADLDNSLFMQATGQSGNPLSGHYEDLAERWAAGRYVLLSPLSATGDSGDGLVLTPAPSAP